MNKTIPEYERSQYPWEKRTTICQNMEDRISIGKMNKTIPEYEKILYLWEKRTTICQNMEDRISIGKNEQDYTRI